jgi:hypothetical protein
MICGNVNGTSGMVIAIIAILALLAFASMLLTTPSRIISISNRYDAWLSGRITPIALILKPRLWLQSQLERRGVAVWVVRAWGALIGVLGLLLLALLLISIFNPCTR